MTDRAQLFDAAKAAHGDRRWSEAEAIYRQILAVAPGDPDATRLHALLAAQQGRPAEALGGTATAVDRAGDPDLHVAVAGALKAGGWMLAAIAALRRALVLSPGFAEAAYNLGNAEAARGRHGAAVEAFGKALTLRPTYTDALNNMAPALLAEGRLGWARRALRRTLALDPGHAGAWSNLAVRSQAIGDGGSAVPGFRRALAADPGQSAIHSNLLFTLTYAADTDDETLYRACRAWESRHAVPLQAEAPPHDNDPDPGRRLRLGYLSADFRDHPVGYNLLGSLERHDRRQVELTLYALPRAGDAMTERFRRTADRWRWVAGDDERQIARRVREDGIDVLILVAPHTADNRPLVAAYRPAPVQVALYDLTTTGMAAVDAWVTDPLIHPPGSGERFIEQLVPVPCLVCHAPPSPSPPLVLPPSASRGGVTFGSFNNPAKMTGDVVALWSRVLSAVPGSRLLLKYLNRYASPELVELMRARFATHGVAPEHLEFRSGRLPRMAQLALLNEVDVALDPFPFNGCTTTFEALWMGVPVVTLEGGRFLGRMSAGFLRQIGLDALVAPDPDAYVGVAAALAHDPAHRSELRQDLRARLLGSPLCDADAHARSLVAVYRRLWYDWCLASRNQSVIEAHRQS